MRFFWKALSLLAILSVPALMSLLARADGPAARPEAKSEPNSEKVNVDNIKQKYWAQGNESEMGVVQNRLYSKEHKFELGLFGGTIVSDPFLNVRNTGGTLGYHFSEYFSAHILAWKSFASNSSALDTFEQLMGATTNYNAPKWYAGTEASASLIYGKLSLMGKSIIYYDLHLLGGLGLTGTESGKYVTPHLGIGQQVYLNKSISIRLDYRLMEYREWILEKIVPTQIGDRKDMRNNYSNVITLGIDILFGPGSR